MAKKIFFLIVFLFIAYEVYQKGIPHIFFPLLSSQCSHHDESDYHVHSTLEIYQDGKTIPIPANLGVFPNCMRPVHTHDSTGLIHIEYRLKFIPTLGDFFDTAGIVLSDNQIGSLKKQDGYHIKVSVDGKKTDSAIRNIQLTDRRKIRIDVASPTYN